MRVMALKDLTVNGRPVRAGAVVNVGKRYAAKLIREGHVRAVEDRAGRLETK